MLQVRSNSWHFWIWSALRKPTSKPKNLCRYFWHIVFKIVATLVVAALALGGIAGLLYVSVTNPWLVARWMMVIAVIFLVAVGIIWLISKWIDHYDAKQERERNIRLGRVTAPPPKQPNFVWAFIKARKQKYCPLIEVVDE